MLKTRPDQEHQEYVARMIKIFLKYPGLMNKELLRMNMSELSSYVKKKVAKFKDSAEIDTEAVHLSKVYTALLEALQITQVLDLYRGEWAEYDLTFLRPEDLAEKINTCLQVALLPRLPKKYSVEMETLYAFFNSVNFADPGLRLISPAHIEVYKSYYLDGRSFDQYTTEVCHDDDPNRLLEEVFERLKPA